MKKNITLILSILFSLFLIIGFLNIIFPVHPAESYTHIPCTSVEMDTAKHIIGTKCIMCHSKDPALPFYARLPLAGTFIQKHIKEGSGMMNLQQLVAGTSTDKWAYDRLEHVITNDTMPINSYLALHWNGKLTPQEQADILSWIHQERSKSQ
jgi:cytochrome c peroxidase